MSRKKKLEKVNRFQNPIQQAIPYITTIKYNKIKQIL